MTNFASMNYDLLVDYFNSFQTYSVEKLYELAFSSNTCIRFTVYHNKSATEKIKLIVKSISKWTNSTTDTPTPPHPILSRYTDSTTQTSIMKINITLSDNFQENLNTVGSLAKEEVSSDFFQTPFFRKWFNAQDLTDLVQFYLVTNYIANVNYLTSIWENIPYDYFQNHQEILTKFEVYSQHNEELVIDWIRESMSDATFLHMISHFYQKEGFQRTLEIFTDTMSQLSKVLSRYSPSGKEVTRPKKWRLEEFHDHMSHLYLESTVENKKHPAEFIPVPVQKGAWKLFEPKDTMDLAMWGRRVRNCVLSYEDKIFGKNSAIVLIEENDKPTYTAELDYQQLSKGKVSFKQLVGLGNRSSDLNDEQRNTVANLIESAIRG